MKLADGRMGSAVWAEGRHEAGQQVTNAGSALNKLRGVGCLYVEEGRRQLARCSVDR